MGLEVTPRGHRVQPPTWGRTTPLQTTPCKSSRKVQFDRSKDITICPYMTLSFTSRFIHLYSLGGMHVPLLNCGTLVRAICTGIRCAYLDRSLPIHLEVVDHLKVRIVVIKYFILAGVQLYTGYNVQPLYWQVQTLACTCLVAELACLVLQMVMTSTRHFLKVAVGACWVCSERHVSKTCSYREVIIVHLTS